MNPGRFWFSVPRPYVSQEPMLGRDWRGSPQFIRSSDGSWFGSSACIPRMTQRSSTDCARFGKSSLTSMPLWPYFLNLKVEGNATLPFVLPPFWNSEGSALPDWRSSAGLGSNVSTCEGPPLAKIWMTRFARPGKWPFLGDRGLSVGASSAKAWPRRSASISAPMPMPPRHRSSRRLIKGSIRVSSVDKDKLVGFEQHVHVLLPRRHGGRRLRRGAREARLGVELLLAQLDRRRPGEAVAVVVRTAVDD